MLDGKEIAMHLSQVQTLSATLDGAPDLQIAHRVESIMDYDRVIVMDAGRIAEDGEPHALAGITNGLFASLVKSAAGWLDCTCEL